MATFVVLFAALVWAPAAEAVPEKAIGVDEAQLSGTVNRAAASAGGTVISVPDKSDAGPRLIDGNLTDGWRGIGALEAGQSKDIVLELGGAPELIDRIVFHTKHWQGGRVPRTIEVAATAQDMDNGYEVIGEFDLLPRKGLQAISFSSRPARFLRIRILSVHELPGRANQPALGEIMVLAADVSKLPAQANRPATITRPQATPPEAASLAPSATRAATSVETDQGPQPQATSSQVQLADASDTPAISQVAPGPTQPAETTNFPTIALPPAPKFARGTILSSLFHTIGDAIVFSYFDDTKIVFSHLDDTKVKLLDHDGAEVGADVDLDRGEYAVRKMDAGTYRVKGTKPFALLIGDPVSQGVVGYYAVDALGRPVAQEFYTYQSNNSDEYPDDENLILFSYEADTRVRITDSESGKVLISKNLDRDTFIPLKLSRRFVHVVASKPVSVLSYTDQGFAVPSSTGSFVGKSFLTYVGAITNGSNDLNILALKREGQITVRDIRSGKVVLEQTSLKAFELKTLRFKDDWSVLKIEATADVAVWVSPIWPNGDYRHLARGVGLDGSDIGKDHVVIGAGETHVLGYEDADVTIQNLANGEIIHHEKIRTGTLLRIDKQLDDALKPVALRISGTGNLATFVSFGGKNGAAFVPLEFSRSTLDVQLTSPAMASALLGSTTIAADVSSSQLYPVTHVQFYLDDALVGIAENPPYAVTIDVGADEKRHEIRAVAYNTAGQTAVDKLTTPAGSGTLRVVTSGEQAATLNPAAIVLVFDLSGSMGWCLDGNRNCPLDKSRLAVAKKVLTEVIRDIPDGTRLGLRVLGNRPPPGVTNNSEVCRDTSPRISKVVPLNEDSRRSLINWIAHQDHGGGESQTSIGYTLSLAAEDFLDNVGIRKVIMVTDGQDDCDTSPGSTYYPERIVKKLRRGGLDITIDIVGFALGSNPQAALDLRNLARLGGGTFYDASDSDRLRRALWQSFNAPFMLLGTTGRQDGKRAGSGVVGGPPVEVPAGIYRLVVRTQRGNLELPEVEVRSRQSTTIKLERQGDRIVYEGHFTNHQGSDPATLANNQLAHGAQSDARPQTEPASRELGFLAYRQDLNAAVAAARAGNFKKSVRLFRRPANNGVAVAQYALGLAYDKGRGVLKDAAQAVYWFRKGAEKGDARAQFELGKSYLQGKGVSLDHARAIFWYRKAAEQGHLEARYSLGAIHTAGTGVQKNYRQAIYWYRKAAEHGYALAQQNLGLMYALGNGVAVDNVKAYAWISISIEQGQIQAEAAKNFLSNLMDSKQIAAARKLTLVFREKYVVPFQNR